MLQVIGIVGLLWVLKIAIFGLSDWEREIFPGWFD